MIMWKQKLTIMIQEGESHRVRLSVLAIMKDSLRKVIREHCAVRNVEIWNGIDGGGWIGTGRARCLVVQTIEREHL